MSRFKTKLSGDSSDGGRLVFVKASDLNRSEFTGVVAEGQFVDTLPNTFNEDKDDFKIVADVGFSFRGINKDGNEYEETVEPGDTLIVNGAGNLGYFMSKVPKGELCQIKYNGMREITSGNRKGKLAHNFEVMTE